MLSHLHIMDTKATIETIIQSTGQADGHAAHLRLRHKRREPGGQEPPPPLARADEIHLTRKCPSVAPGATDPQTGRGWVDSDAKDGK